MSDGEYGYLADRLVAEQNRARIATCKEAETVHQKLADAYIKRLQSLILSPSDHAKHLLLKDGEWLCAVSAESGRDRYLHLRIGDTHRGNPI